MQNNIEEAIQAIELTGIVDELPSTVTTNDKYFNKTDNKIYTATADTWGVGEIPSKDNFYINKSDNTLFYFNGETLINIGGAQSGEDLSSIYGQINEISSTVSDLFNHDNNVKGKFIKNGGYMKQYYSSISDFNNALTEGYYQIVGQNITSAPYQGYIYGKLTVDINDCTYFRGTNNWIWQTFIDTYGNEFRRQRINNGSWSEWATISTSLSNAIEDKGTNANGTYIKYADGRMECYGTVSLGNQTFNTEYWSSFNRSGNENMYVNYAAEFIDVPTCVMNLNTINTWPILKGTGTSSRGPTFVAVCPKTHTVDQEIKVSYHAIGKWK